MNFLLKLFPTLLKLMAIAEAAFSQPKSGEAKKALVVEGAKAVVDGIEDVSTGGQAETWKRIGPGVDKLIDATAEIVFPKSE